MGKTVAEGLGVFLFYAGMYFNALQIESEKGSFLFQLLF